MYVYMYIYNFSRTFLTCLHILARKKISSTYTRIASVHTVYVCMD